MDMRWRVLGVLTLARCAMAFQLQVVGSTAAELKAAFDLDNAAIGFLIGLYLLPGIVVAFPSGMIGKRFGDRRVVLFGLMLMVLGGTISAVADTHVVLFSGRAVAGVGGVLFTVLLAKIVTDQFIGKEIVLAMAIMLNSFPVGIALGQYAFPLLAESVGWRAAQWTSTAAALAALLLVLTLYRETRGSLPVEATRAAGSGRLDRAELVQICLLGVAWGALNGALVAVTGFAPTLLREAGYATETAAALLSLATVLIVVSVQTGGWLGQNYVSPRLLAWLGLLLYGLGFFLAAAPGWELAGLAFANLLGCVGASSLFALVGGNTRPDNRAVGFGVFLTWLYIGFALIPMFAGLLARGGGGARGAMLLAGGVCLVGVAGVLSTRSAAGPAPANR